LAAWFGSQLVPGAVLCPHLLRGEPGPNGQSGAVYVRNEAGETMALCVRCIETLRPLLTVGDPGLVEAAMRELGYQEADVSRVLADMRGDLQQSGAA
jgi:hypothetical protein